MNTVIPLDGMPTIVEMTKVKVSDLVLDIGNPRIQYYLDTRIKNSITIEEIELAIAESNEQFPRLKEHIEQNGGIYNAIWVIRQNDGRFRVIEGNTRALIYSELGVKYINEPKWKVIDSYILPSAVERKKINFIRLEAHLFGPTPWDAYEKARELYRLNSEEDYSIQRLQQLTKLGAYEIKNNIQAFKDMEEQYFPVYKKPGEQLKFSYFAEFRKNKDLRKLVQDGKLTLEQFCDLVGEGKFKRGEDVRRLAKVWKDEEARDVLIDENMEEALSQLAQKDPAAKSKLFEKMRDVSNGIETMPFGELDEIKSGLQPAKVNELIRLKKVVSKLLNQIGVVG